MVVIQTVDNCSAAKAFKCFDFETAVERPVQRCMAEPHVASGVKTRTTDLSASTILSVNFV